MTLFPQEPTKKLLIHSEDWESKKHPKTCLCKWADFKNIKHKNLCRVPHHMITLCAIFKLLFEIRPLCRSSQISFNSNMEREDALHLVWHQWACLNNNSVMFLWVELRTVPLTILSEYVRSLTVWDHNCYLKRLTLTDGTRRTLNGWMIWQIMATLRQL